LVDHEGDVLYLRLEPLSWGQEIRNYPTINVVGRYLVATCKAAADSRVRHTSIAMNIVIYLIVGLLAGLLLPQLVMMWLG
jgi:hypothetical protein